MRKTAMTNFGPMLGLLMLTMMISGCQNSKPCPLNMINPNSCGYGTYTFSENGCTVTNCRPSKDFTCKDMNQGDSYFDGCNTCSCTNGGDRCTRLACGVKEGEQNNGRIRGEGEMCGGIAGFMCEDGLICIVKEKYPDAAGTCIRSSAKGEEDVALISLKDYERKIDYSCSKDSDCEIKDVHNCCGYFPKCVNIDSYTNPEQVKELCIGSGQASICGFPSVTSCSCVDGQCTGN